MNADDSHYCRACGTRLAAQTFSPCRHCGATNPSESLYCSHCGGTLLSPSPLIARPKFTFPQPDSDPPTAAPSAPEALPARDTKPIREPAAPSQGLIPTHELLRMANAIGIDIDYSTLRFWQKRGLVSRPLRGPVESGRGTRGYYDASLIERLGFIREIQKTYSLGLDAIRDELQKIDQDIAIAGDASRVYRERLTVLQSHRETESKRTLLGVLARVLNIPADEIAIVSVRKKDGQSVRVFTDRSLREPGPEMTHADLARLLDEEKEKTVKKTN
ncbi:MAG: MerR family transcriptional regulator [Chloroflexi bacterium]|nr:MerR family transcriptional regulator [Chloroflexota bacterium]